MKTLKVILFIVIILIVTLTLTFAFYGGFKKVVVSINDVPDMTIVYEELTGDYGQTSEVTDRIYFSLLEEAHIETYQGIGIFHDNPDEVPKDDLHFEAGCVLEYADSLLISTLKIKNYNVKTFPAGKYITAEFPFKGFMSIMLGIMKVYPAMNQFKDEKGIMVDNPMMEIYDVPNRKIIYRTAVNKD